MPSPTPYLRLLLEHRDVQLEDRVAPAALVVQHRLRVVPVLLPHLDVPDDLLQLRHRQLADVLHLELLRLPVDHDRQRPRVVVVLRGTQQVVHALVVDLEVAALQVVEVVRVLVDLLEYLHQRVQQHSQVVKLLLSHDLTNISLDVLRLEEPLVRPAKHRERLPRSSLPVQEDRPVDAFQARQRGL